MKFLNNRMIGISLLFIVALLYIVLTVAVRLSLNNTNSRMRDGYYTLVLETDAPILDIVAELECITEWEIISEYSSTVQIFSHTGEVHIPVSELKTYYVDGDFLFDPFLKKLPALFKAKSLSDNYSLVYIGTEISPEKFSDKITEIMSIYPYNWFIPELKNNNQFVIIVIFSIVVILLFFLNKKLWPFLILEILPWFLFAVYSELSGAIASIIFLLGWMVIVPQLYNSFCHYLNLGRFDTIDRKKLIVSIFIMVLSIFYIILNSRNLSDITSYILVLLAHFSFVAFYIIILWYKNRLQQHRFFFPVRIRYKSKNAKIMDFVILGSSIILIIISPLIIQGNKSKIDIELPFPVLIKGITDFSQVSMQILNKHSSQSELPNLSDYISHMMFLETYPYGYNYMFPEPNQSLSVPFFSIVEGRITKKNVSINTFTDRWYEDIINSGSNTEIIKLLRSSNLPTILSYKFEGQTFIDDKFYRNHYMVSIFLVLAFIVWFGNLFSSKWYGAKYFVVRRKQQVV